MACHSVVLELVNMPVDKVAISIQVSVGIPGSSRMTSGFVFTGYSILACLPEEIYICIYLHCGCDASAVARKQDVQDSVPGFRSSQSRERLAGFEPLTKLMKEGLGQGSSSLA
jgi:hypothetical protein